MDFLGVLWLKDTMEISDEILIQEKDSCRIIFYSVEWSAFSSYMLKDGNQIGNPFTQAQFFLFKRARSSYLQMLSLHFMYKSHV